MTQEYEKLVDDVMAFICEHGVAAGIYVGFGREDAKELITRIGKAYAEGLPLPGEVGRIVYSCMGKPGHRLKDLAFMDGDTLVALRKEEKGEEPCQDTAG